MTVVPSVERKGKNSWQARWRDPSGSQRKRTFTGKGLADDFLAKVSADIQRGAYIDHRAGRITLADYAERHWIPSLVNVRPSTLVLYRQHLKSHILPALGSRHVGSLQTAECKRFVASLSAHLAPTTVGTVHAVLRMLMQSAVDDGLIAVNPCARVPLPRVEQRILEPLPAASVTALAGAMPPRYAVTVWLAAGAGLRQGEALGLTAARVDFLPRRIHVEQQIQGLNGGEPELCPLKTKASRRIVPVDDIVLQVVTGHMARWGPGPGGLLVTNRLGRPVRRSSFGQCWSVAVQACGLPTGTRFHDLRHFYASTLIRSGMHAKAIQARLGHKSITETMDTYGHLFPDHEDLGRGVFDSMLGPTSCAPGVPLVCPGEAAD